MLLLHLFINRIHYITTTIKGGKEGMGVPASRKLLTLLSTCSEDQSPLREIIKGDFEKTALYERYKAIAPESIFDWQHKNTSEIYRQIDELHQIEVLHEQANNLLFNVLMKHEYTTIKKLRKPNYFDMQSMLAFVSELETLATQPSSSVNITNYEEKHFFHFFDLPFIYSLEDIIPDEDFSVVNNEHQNIERLLGDTSCIYAIDQAHYEDTLNWIKDFQTFYALTDSQFTAFTEEGRTSVAQIQPIFKELIKGDFHASFKKVKNYRSEISRFIHLLKDTSTIHMIHQTNEQAEIKKVLDRVNQQLNNAIHSISFTEIARLAERTDVNNLNDLYQLDKALSDEPLIDTYINNLEAIDLEMIINIKDTVQTTMPKNDKKLTFETVSDAKHALDDYFGSKKYSISQLDFELRAFELLEEREARNCCLVCGKKLSLLTRKKTEHCFRHRPISETFTLLATKNNAIAALVIAVIIALGLFFNVDKKLAIKGLEATDGLNISGLQYYVGKEYFFGEYIAQDIDKGLHYLEIAADKENARAQMQLGSFYMSGISQGLEVLLEEDYELAKSYLEKSIENGEPTAYALLANLYYEGLGVEKDEAKAFELINESLTYDFANKPFVLGMLGAYYDEAEGDMQDDEEAFKYYLKASEAGFRPSMKYVSEFYEYGVGVEKDLEEAEYWMRKYEKAEPFRLK